jgi:hypothetical protein
MKNTRYISYRYQWCGSLSFDVYPDSVPICHYYADLKRIMHLSKNQEFFSITIHVLVFPDLLS